MKIINLATFWCTVRYASQLLKLSLILSRGWQTFFADRGFIIRGHRVDRGRGYSYDH
jgi:hypothetical protein